MCVTVLQNPSDEKYNGPCSPSCKKASGEKPKEIWQAPDQEEARKRGKEFCDTYEKRCPKAIEIL